MKKIFSLLAISYLTLGAAFAQAEGAAIPSTQVTSLNGKKVAFNSTVATGKVTMISFWATWCVPCKKEIKSIRENLANWQSEVPEFNYMTVSVDDARATAQVRAYAKSQGWDFPTYLDPNSDLKRSLNFQDVPFVIIVDKEGKVAYQHSGYEEGGEIELFEKVKELAAQ